MQQQEKMVLGVSLVVTLIAGWVQVGEAKAEARARAPECLPELIVFASGSCGSAGEQAGDCLRYSTSNCVLVPTSCEDNGGDSNGYALYCAATQIPGIPSD